MVFCAGMCWLAATAAPPQDHYFLIRAVDEETGRGVPLVELRTTGNGRYVTDSNGLVAFLEPGLMNQTVFFHIKSHGYEYPANPFGFRGIALKITPGGRAELKLKRLNIAQRLYRVTGGGIYRDSVLVGEPCPLREPLLNARVMGSDSVMCALFRGRLYWFWGDTHWADRALGNFHVTGATSMLPADGGLDPNRGVDLTYILDDQGHTAPCAQMPGQGPTWIDGLVVLRDVAGHERMFAAYVKVRGFLEVYRRGLAEFDASKQRFVHVTEFPMGHPVYPHGHPFVHPSGGVSYVYFANPYPLVRVRAAPECLSKLEEYEAFSCLTPGSRLEKPTLDRDAAGRLRYAWKRDTPAVYQADQAKLIRSGTVNTDEVLLHLQDVETGREVKGHAGSTYWNAYRQRWVMIVEETGGSSPLGEIWFAEADTPVGPWVYARKIVTHDAYSFYNPAHHPEFDQCGGRIIYFEGTYSDFFSGSGEKTPFYDYNQIMYLLDLSDERLVLPVAFSPSSEEAPPEPLRSRRTRPGVRSGPIAFFACERSAPGTVPITWTPVTGGGYRLMVSPNRPPPDQTRQRTLFYAISADAKSPPATTIELWEFAHKDGVRRLYSTDAARSIKDYQRSERPLCRVWRSPFHASFDDWGDAVTNGREKSARKGGASLY